MTDASDLGRALAALRPRATYTCAMCGKEYVARSGKPRGMAHTCSNRCRQQLFRLRKRNETDPKMSG
jgi:predicted RNA-binding Zn-ribbon protein involved in translation (DUF1610 family)